MTYAIYGINRVTEDFLYIFNQVNVVCFFEESGIDQFKDKPVYPIEDLKRHIAEWDQIIICDFIKRDKQATLEQMGLRYQRDFIYEEDLFYQLDEVQYNPMKKKVIIWGAGVRANDFIEKNKQYLIEFCVDTYKNSNVFNGLKIKRPAEIQNWKEWFIIIAIAKNEEVEEQLISYGLEKNIDFCLSQEIEMVPSQLLRKTIFDRSNYDLECNTMLNHVEIGASGKLDCCCTTFVRASIGNLRRKKIAEIWNGNIHKILCLSTQNRTYSFCDKEMCPLFIGKESSSENKKVDIQYNHIEKSPRTILIAFDFTCNLKCITCRQELYLATGKELGRMQDYAHIVEQELLPECEFLILAGNGEVFASRAYKTIYTSAQTKNIKWIRLLSNGTLFNQKTWNEFTKDKKCKVMLTVSIDAATSETYSKIRCGGDFEQLQKNMKFASELRKKGDLSYFRFNFVVQRENYQEMALFVKWGLELDVDEIFFTKILNWGTYNDEEFKEVSMMEEDGITPKEELKRVLNDPIMKNPIVDLGTIQYNRNSLINGKIVQNYYRWELERQVPHLFM